MLTAQRARFGGMMRKTSAIIRFACLCVAVIPSLAFADEADARSIPGEKPRVRQQQLPAQELPDINSSVDEYERITDRWGMFYQGKWYDPYNQNRLKADLPMFGEPGHEWFVELSAISDTMLEFRTLPVPVGAASTQDPNSLNTFGDGRQEFVSETLTTSFALIRGNTSFKPPELEFRVSPVFNANYANTDQDGLLRADPSRGHSRTDAFLGFQDLFADVHLANVSERYDFVSTRIGIQKFISDFRGFVYVDDQPGVRVFGNLNNNLWQYNVAWFSRLDKDTNTGLNTFNSRYEDVAIANLYRQDMPVLGHTTQLSYIFRDDDAGSHKDHYDQNGFLVRPAQFGDQRPKNIRSHYIGLAGEGHFDRINSSFTAYYVFGDETHGQLAQRPQDISAGMAAWELSYDIDWIRLRTSVLWASGDDDAFDGTAGGFDAVFENPNFAGGDFGYWQRQGIPFIGGGGVALVGRNSLFPSLRAGREEGQSNFVNPGLRLVNVGLDAELMPTLKLVTNATYYQFDDTAVLKAMRQDATIGREIGWDVSVGFLYRPFMHNNVQVRFGTAALFPGEGMKDLFRDQVLYDVFTNLVLQY